MFESDAASVDVRPVILCGGSGTRLWPLSREHYPKQLLALNGERTLLQETVLRCRALGGLEDASTQNPLVVCNSDHGFLVADQLRRAGAGGATLLVEPFARGTAPALTVAAVHALGDDDPVLLVMPSDHAIADADGFGSAVEAGVALARSGHVVTFGVRPTSAQTGYGYIRAVGCVRGAGEGASYVDAFVEKPDARTARMYVDSGDYLWNSGIFAVRASVWIDCIGRYREQILASCERAHRAGLQEHGMHRLDSGCYEACPADSIDYAVMERLGAAHGAHAPGPEAVVVRLDAGWSDIGAWDALWDIEPKDASGNVVHGDVHTIGTRNALLISRHRLLACVGLEDVVVIETPDAVMVAHKDRVQDIRAMVARLKEAGRSECVSHRKVHRPWGSFDWLESGDRFQVKRISVEPGASLSLQMHFHRAEHWVVVKGTARVQRDDKTFLLTENQSTYIPLGVPHRLENPGRVPLEMIEVQSGAYLGEDDIVRYEDAYGRSVQAR
jgi:mannose-1-phosphate guanylyltransferase / mannose-6-phosphate isomerase